MRGFRGDGRMFAFNKKTFLSHESQQIKAFVGGFQRDKDVAVLEFVFLEPTR